MRQESRTCPSCGTGSTASASFCPNCGRRLDADRAAVPYASSPRRLFGVLSPVATFVLGCVLLLGALTSFLAGSPILGIVLLAASAAVFVLFFGAVERDPSSRLARRALTAKDRVRGWTSFITGSASAWARAGREVLRLRGQLRTLRAQRQQVLLELGDAAFREDDAAVASLRGRMREIEAEIAARVETRAATLARARNRVSDERLAVRGTEVLSPADAERARGTREP